MRITNKIPPNILKRDWDITKILNSKDEQRTT